MKLSIVVPCYNEKDNIIEFYKQVNKVFKDLSGMYEIIFVNDGSTDNTIEVLKTLKDPSIKIINFSRNFGKEAAMLAGMKHSKAEMLIIMDADLQHPITVAYEMYQLANNDSSIDTVVARRVVDSKSTNSYFKRKMFYKLINKLSDVEIIDGVGDFRLMRNYVINAVLELEEHQRFSKGIFEWVGFKKTYLDFTADERFAGESRWSTKDLVKYAIDGILAFSIKPLRISLVLGIIMIIMSFITLTYGIVQWFLHNSPDGYATIVSLILIGFSITLLTLGIIGEYISRIYIEVKKRPNYLIMEIIENEDTTK